MNLFFPILLGNAEPYQDFLVQESYNETSVSKNQNKTDRSKIKSSETFLEFNFGLAEIKNYSFRMPGLSFVIGNTFEHSGLLYELQFGGALPAIVTGKIGVGYGDFDHNLLCTLRLWPLFIGPQFKHNKWTFSLEVGTSDEASFNGVYIGTIGYRDKIKP